MSVPIISINVTASQTALIASGATSANVMMATKDQVGLRVSPSILIGRTFCYFTSSVS